MWCVAGLSEEQRYLWDLQGVLHLKCCMTPAELAAARAAVDEYASFETHPQDLPEGFAVPEGGRGSFPHGFAFSEALESLAWWVKTVFLNRLYMKNEHFIKTGSGQT
jgi:hypothetical protein